MVTLLHRYQYRGGAKRLMGCKDGEVLLSGPAGTGKSRACLEKVNRICLKYPGARALIVRKTLVSLTNSGLVTWQKHVIPEGEVAGIVRWFGGSRREPAAYRYSNGSEVVVGGLDDPTKIMSTEYDIVFVQEAIELTLTDWESIVSRLRNGVVPYQQVIADTNPSMPTHWLKQRCDAGITTLIESRHEDNPLYFDAIETTGFNSEQKSYIYNPTKLGTDYISRLDKLTGVRYQRLRKGLWTSAEGVIYDNFDPTIHVLDRFVIPSDWKRIWTVDFGFTNPFVWQDWAIDPDGRIYLDKEIYHTSRLVSDHAKAILNAVTKSGVWTEAKPSHIICDHDAEGRATLEKELKMSTVAAKKEVSNGIQAVQQRLTVAADGKPRLYFLRGSLTQVDTSLRDVHKPLNTVDEITGYVWDPVGKTPKEAPLKENDHGMDAMRYAVAHLDMRSRNQVRVFDGAGRRW